MTATTTTTLVPIQSGGGWHLPGAVIPEFPFQQWSFSICSAVMGGWPFPLWTAMRPRRVCAIPQQALLSDPDWSGYGLCGSGAMTLPRRTAPGACQPAI
jgi:hypothetical protein